MKNARACDTGMPILLHCLASTSERKKVDVSLFCLFHTWAAQLAHTQAYLCLLRRGDIEKLSLRGCWCQISRDLNILPEDHIPPDSIPWGRIHCQRRAFAATKECRKVSLKAFFHVTSGGHIAQDFICLLALRLLSKQIRLKLHFYQKLSKKRMST